MASCEKGVKYFFFLLISAAAKKALKVAIMLQGLGGA